MNKYLQILLGVATTVWLIIGIGIIAVTFWLISVGNAEDPSPYIKLLNYFTSRNRIEYQCISDKVGTESAQRVIVEDTEPITKEFIEKIEPCHR